MFPLLVARGAHAVGRPVVCAGFRRCAWPELRAEVDHFDWVGVLQLKSWIRYLRSHGVEEAIMVGRVQKATVYDRWRYFHYLPDLTVIRLYLTTLRHDKRPYSILKAVCNELASAGIQLIDSTKYCAEHLADAGVMTRRQPTPSQWNAIHFGWERCSTISRLDIGQAIAVMDQDVIAVEALEGTNAMIERAGQLCRMGGWTMIKVANTNHDMRLDVPTIGMHTIEKLHAARAECLVLEAGKTIILEKPKVIELADR